MLSTVNLLKTLASNCKLQVLDLKSFASNTLRARPLLRKYLGIGFVGVGFLISRILCKQFRGWILKSPPQLYGFPLIGSLITMILWKQNFALKLLPKYGDLVTFNLGPMKFCRINEIELANQILKLAVNRPPIFTNVSDITGVEPLMIGINDDKQWKYRRQKMIRYLTTVLNRFVLFNLIIIVFLCQIQTCANNAKQPTCTNACNL